MAKYDFDAIVIGGGAAGLTASGIAANFGAKTMMIEKDRLGGDCTWTGCVPSKVLLKAGKVAHQIKHASQFGLIDQQPEINFEKVIEHIHQTRQDIYEDADRPEIFEDMGIEVVKGVAHFLDDHQVAIQLEDGTTRRVSARYFIICAGASAFTPPIEGLNNVSYLTNDSLFEISDLPQELTVIGAGPIGTEMAQALERLGSTVTVIDVADRIMTNDDPELTGKLKESLEKEGIKYVLGAEVKRVSQRGDAIITAVECQGEEKQITGDQLLMATGRRANVDGLGLDAAGVEYTDQGIEVNDRCRTNKSHIYACGDITGQYQFTHMSEHMAKVATTHALLKFPMKIDRKNVPWVTFTDPELGHVGATEQELKSNGNSYETYRFPYSKIDRALTEAEGEGLIKIHAKKWNGKIYGASVLGAHAGELISEYAVAMKNGVTLRNLADTIHPYPTYSLGARRAADQWYIKNQSEWQIKFFQKIFGLRGDIPDLSDPDRIV
ncbi:dihydrolipoyl dehydrogenase family protein [Fodinibius salsisoli]|uniref:FAD-dependent oxidoreductase n=1 Tax=Fodinibius salsisoli TaxID=2820877 RepID=A0ABT3PLX0_9BACT|nr:FAD-dependent oxidoreductase [Fodinibius salsisoli]MCW9706718.1 FAD-dependent oxidoreductase [Fodinibius salsisoli]